MTTPPCPRRYATEDDAHAALRVLKLPGWGARECDTCTGWHLGAHGEPCTPDDRCVHCRRADACTRDRQHAAAHAYRILARSHHRRHGYMPDPAEYTREAAADAVLAELTSLTPAPSEGDDHV